MITIEQVTSNFNSLLKYFFEYWKTNDENFLSNTFNNKIIANENFPEYGTLNYTACIHGLTYK